MSADRSHLLIVNPSSGGGRVGAVLPEVEDQMRSRGLRSRTVMSKSLEHGIEEAVAAHRAGVLPVVMSGDGLIGQIGGALAGQDAAIGLVPGGRGNDLARVLGIPSDPAGAADVLAAGNEREIDVGEVNGRRFLGVASFGFDSDANRIANDAKLIRGNLVYAYAAIRALAGWKTARFTVELGGGDTREFAGYSVAVANSGAFGGGMLIAPDAEIDDGRFDVVMAGDAGKLRFLRSFPKLFKGEHVHEAEIEVRRAATVRATADRPFAVYADGEHLTDLPAEMRVLPRALRVIAPPPGAGR